MATPEASLVIPYGAGLAVTVAAGRPLRLNTMAWDFPERPDLTRLATVSERLDFLRDHLMSLCGIWDKLPRRFLDVYFRHVARCITDNRGALDGIAAAHGGLFAPEDWSFSALCPLPQARLPTSPETPVDFAFWTTDGLLALDIVGAGAQGRARRDAGARLRENGIPVIEITGAELERAEAGDLASQLPPEFSDFWRTEPLPSSPFRIGSLGEILRA